MKKEICTQTIEDLIAERFFENLNGDGNFSYAVESDGIYGEICGYVERDWYQEQDTGAYVTTRANVAIYSIEATDEEGNPIDVDEYEVARQIEDGLMSL